MQKVNDSICVGVCKVNKYLLGKKVMNDIKV